MSYPLYNLVKFLKGEVCFCVVLVAKTLRHLKEQYMKADA